MQATRITRSLFICLLLLTWAAVSVAAEAAEPQDAVAVFEEVLADKGIDAAMARLEEMKADTTGAYVFEPREVVAMAPNRMVAAGMPAEALRFLRAFEADYGSHYRYWQGVGELCILIGDKECAAEGLGKVLEAHPERSDMAWRIENLDRLIETARVQLEAHGRYEPGENTGIKGPYLGQEPPGDDFEVFAPGLLSGVGHEYSITFTPDGKEIYFSRGGEGTLVCRLEKRGWTAPEPITFVEENEYDDEPNISPDGERIVVCSRPTMRESRQLYVADREGDGWGEPRHLFRGMYATSTLDGHLYYTLDPEDQPGNSDIVKSSYAAGEWGEPAALEGGVNSDMQEAHPYVAPDESYVIFDTYRGDKMGMAICYRDADGTWGEPTFLSEELGIPYAGQAMVSPDGKYFFFCFSSDMYWMKADFIEDLRPE
jgi:hypothetical protein